MTDLIVSGTVTDRGATCTRILILNIVVTLWRQDQPVSHIYEADVTSGGAGQFSWVIDIEQAVEDDFTVTGSAANGSGTAGGLVSVDVTAYLPGASSMRYQSAVVANFNHGQTFVGIVNSLVDDLHYDIDLSGLNTISVNGILDSGSTTEDAFKNVDGLLLELMHIPPPTTVKVLGISQTITHAPTVYGRLPAVREGNTYSAKLFYDPTELQGGQQFFRFRSDGPDFNGKVIARTPVLTTSWLPGLQTTPFAPSNPFEALLISRFDQTIGIGTISAGFPDRSFKFPFVLKDPDLDFADGKIRVRGAVGIGTGKNTVLFTIGHFEALFSLTPVNYENQPFQVTELLNFFKVTVVDSKFDVLPGTDLDDLPWWVYVAIGAMRLTLGLGPSLYGSALVIQAIEAIFRPVIADQVEQKALAAINSQLEEQVNDEIDEQIEQATELAANAGVPLADKDIAAMRANVWIEAESVTIDSNNIRVTGWAGVLHDLVNALQDSILGSSCPFNAASGQNGGGSKSTAKTSALPIFRDYQAVLDVAELKPWMDRYMTHRPELLKIVQTRPKVVTRLLKMSRTGHDAARKPDWKMSAKTVNSFAELAKDVRLGASPGLAKFMDDLESVIQQGQGRTVEELRTAASRHILPSPMVRPVPSHRMGQAAQQMETIKPNNKD